MNQLETQFHQAMIQTYEDALHDCNYRATAFLHMVLEHGGVETAKRLLATSQAQSGLYELFTCGRLDLTVEAKVVSQEFQSLFTKEELAEARSGVCAGEHRIWMN
jgi:hypothetical protein